MAKQEEKGPEAADKGGKGGKTSASDKTSKEEVKKAPARQLTPLEGPDTTHTHKLRLACSEVCVFGG